MSRQRRFAILPFLVGCFLVLTAGEVAAQQQILVLQEPKWGTGFGAEAILGELRFDGRVGLKDQEFFGGLAGVYLGRGTTVRGYYWRGYNDSAWAPIQSYGGEFQFDLLSVGPVRPFLLAGAGRLDFMDDYLDEFGEKPDDATVLTYGGGIGVHLTKWLWLDVAGRGYAMEGPKREALPDLEPKTRHHFVLSAGLGVRFGGIPSSPKTVGAEGAAGVVVAGGAAPGNVATIPVPVEGEIRVSYGRDSLAQRVADQAGIAIQDSTGRILYTGNLSREAVRELLRTELGYLDALYPADAPIGAPRTALSGDRLDTLSTRLGQRFNEVFDYVAQMEVQAMMAALDAELDSQGISGRAKEQVLASSRATLDERLRLTRAQSLALLARRDSLTRLAAARPLAPTALAYVGGSFGDASQFVVGGRGVFGLKGVDRITLGPEAAIGFLSGTTALIQGVGLHHFQTGNRKIEPYAGLGLGVLVRSGIEGQDGSTFTATPVVGVTFYSSGASKLFGPHAQGYFIEYQGVDFFGISRILAGVRWGI